MFWSAVKMHPAVAAGIVVVIALVFLGLLAKLRNAVVALPGVGPIAAKVPQIGA